MNKRLHICHYCTNPPVGYLLEEGDVENTTASGASERLPGLPGDQAWHVTCLMDYDTRRFIMLNRSGDNYVIIKGDPYEFSRPALRRQFASAGGSD